MEYGCACPWGVDSTCTQRGKSGVSSLKNAAHFVARERSKGREKWVGTGSRLVIPSNVQFQTFGGALNVVNPNVFSTGDLQRGAHCRCVTSANQLRNQMCGSCQSPHALSLLRESHVVVSPTSMQVSPSARRHCCDALRTETTKKHGV